MRSRARLLLGFLSSIAAASATLSAAAPAGALSFSFAKVVESGDAASGLPAGTTFTQFSGVSLNGVGEFVFSTFVAGTSITPGADDQLIYRAASGGALVPLVRRGDAAPGAGAGIVYDIPGPAVQNDAGQIAYSPHLSDGASTFGALYVPGVAGPFAVEGDPAPGAGGATWNSFTHLITPTLNAAGDVAFQANLSGTGFGSSVWGGAGGAPALVAKEGDPAPGFAAGVEHDALIHPPLLNDTGRLAFAGALGGTGGGEEVLWVRDGAAAPTALVQGSASAAALLPTESFGDLSLLELNDAGQVVFHSLVAGATPLNDGALWRATGVGAPSLVAREGAAAPGTGAGVVFADVLSGRLAENGRLAFAATLGGSGVSGANDRALYLADASDQLDLILRSGDAAPGLAGLVIADLPFDPLVDADGNVAFRAELGGAGVDASNDLALFYYDVVNDTLTLVAREGDVLLAGPGDPRTIGTLFAPLLNDANQLGLFVSYVGGGQGIYLSAIPEPGTASLLALGLAAIAARRRARRRG